MEIFGILILLCLLSVVAFYLKIDVLGKLSSIWDDITLAIGNKRLYYARKREDKEKAIKAIAKEQARAWQELRNKVEHKHQPVRDQMKKEFKQNPFRDTIGANWTFSSSNSDIDRLFKGKPKTQRVGSPYGYTYTDPKQDMLNVQIDSLKKQIAIQSELQTKLNAISRRVGRGK